MKIHQDIKGRNRYCGPAAIAYATGFSTDDAATVIRQVSGQDRVIGTRTHHLVEALGRFGIIAKQQYDVKGKTLAGWLKASVKQRTSGRVFLVVAGRHFQLVTGRRYACGRIRDGLVSIKDKRVKRRARVESVHELSLMSGGIKEPAALKSQKGERRALQSARYRAKKLADEHGIEIDIDHGGRDERTHYWVFAKKATEEHSDYPFEGDHICLDWREIEWRIKDIIRFEAKVESGELEPQVAAMA